MRVATAVKGPRYVGAETNTTSPMASSQWKAMYIVPLGWKAGDGVRLRPQQG